MNPPPVVATSAVTRRARAAQDRDDRLTALMVDYQAGSIDAFDKLYSELAPDLRVYLKVKVWDSAQVEDLLQETFLRLHRSRHTYLSSRPVRPWAYGIARYVYLMHVRSCTRRAKRELSWSEPPEMPVAASAEETFDAERCRRAVEQIPSDQRDSLAMHVFLGMTHAEIGGVLGISEGASKLRAFRGRKALRRVLGNPFPASSQPLQERTA